MRIAAIVVGLIAVVGSASAQGPTYDAVIQKALAEVRGGRSAVFPVTAVLRQNYPVRVIREEAGWLAVAPPEGSSSWVMERVLDQPPKAGVKSNSLVLADDAPVLLGAADNPAPFPNQVATLKRGTWVTVLGQKATSDALGEKTTWWRIEAAPSEVRWVAKDAIVANTAYSTTRPTSTNPSAAAPPGLWAMAEQAERAGNFAQAIVWYRQISSEQSRPGGDFDLARRAYDRADWLGKNQPPATKPSAVPALSNSTTGPWTAGVLMTSGPGLLRRAAFQIDNQTTYIVEDSRGNPRVYVTPQSGLNLEPFINRQIELHGYMINKPELAVRGYLSANKVHVLR